MLAQLYHAHHSRHHEDLPFWLSLAARQGGPVLELGCGTGRVLLPLARAGYAAFGLDSDARMLACLQAQASADPSCRARFFQADMAAFHLARQFPLILLPCNTLSTLPAETRSAALMSVRRHLSPQGVFAASLPNPALLARLPRRSAAEIEEVFPHPRDGEPVQVSSAWQRSAGHCSITWHYDHLLPNGRTERLTAQVRHALLPIEQYTEEYRQAGFRLAAQYGDFDQSPYQAEAPYLILVAQAGR